MDSLIFPAPSSTYTAESLKENLVWIPKFDHSMTFLQGEQDTLQKQFQS